MQHVQNGPIVSHMDRQKARVVNNENRVHQFQVNGQMIMLNPGVNEVDSELWAAAQQDEGVKRLLDADVAGPNGQSAEQQHAAGERASLAHGSMPGPGAPGAPTSGAPEPSAIPAQGSERAPDAPAPKKILAMASDSDGAGAPAQTMPLNTSPNAPGSAPGAGGHVPHASHAGTHAGAPGAAGAHGGATGAHIDGAGAAHATGTHDTRTDDDPRKVAENAKAGEKHTRHG